jgi:hypothetical protein
MTDLGSPDFARAIVAQADVARKGPIDSLARMAKTFPPTDPSPQRTAENTAKTAEAMSDLIGLVDASLKVSEDMRDHAIEATRAAERSGRHALIIAYVFGGGSLIVSIVSLVIALSH